MVSAKDKVTRWFFVLAWMAFMFFLSNQPGLKSSFEPIVDFILRKLAHLTEYFILAWLLYRALSLSAGKKQALVWTLVLAFVFALSDEWHQTFVRQRNGNPRDVGIDLVGILAAVYWLKVRFFK